MPTQSLHQSSAAAPVFLRICVVMKYSEGPRIHCQLSVRDVGPLTAISKHSSHLVCALTVIPISHKPARIS